MKSLATTAPVILFELINPVDKCSPHLPWAVPEAFYDLYPDAAELPGPKYPNVTVNAPLVAWHTGKMHACMHLVRIGQSSVWRWKLL
jgi:hypothetical protein